MVSHGVKIAAAAVLLGIGAMTVLPAVLPAQNAQSPQAEPGEAQTGTPTVAPSGGDIFGNWRVACGADGAQPRSCRVAQLQTLRESGALVGRFVIIPRADGSALFVAQTQSGLFLPGGAVYRFAGENAGESGAEQRDMVWQTCAQGICEAAALLSADELAQFAGQETLLFGYRRSAEGAPTVLPVSLDGFSDALAAARDRAAQ